MRLVKRLDRQGVHVLNGLVCRWGPARLAVTVLASRGAAMEVLLMLLLGVRGQVGTMARVFGSVVLVYGLTEAIGSGYRRQRPFVSVDSVRELIQHQEHRSFPSRHVASAFAMAAVAGPTHTSIGRAMERIAWLLALSRVGAGVHYPSDVAAGVLLGKAVGRLVRLTRGDGR